MYTKEEEKELCRYPEASVEELAEKLGKSKRSIIAKLAKMKLYQTQPRTTKTGDKIISKEDLVAELEFMLDIEIPTLVKSGKEDLRKLEARVRELIES